MTFPDNTFLKEVITNAKLFMCIVLSTFLTYILTQYTERVWNQILKIKNHPITKDWICFLKILFITLSRDQVALHRVLVNHFSDIKNTPHSFNAGLFTWVYVDKPDDLQIILNNPNVLEKGDLYKFFRDTMGQGLIVVEVSQWKRKRRQIAPLFSANSVENYLHIFNRHASELSQKLRPYCDTDESFDLWNSISKTALSTIFDVVLGTDTRVSEKEKEAVIHAIDKIAEILSLRMFSIWLHPNFMYKLYLSLTGYTTYFDLLHNSINQILEDKKSIAERKLESVKEHDEDSTTLSYMDHLLRQNEEGTNHTDEKVRHEINTLISAGSETNALAICFTLIMLAMNPEIQEKVYEEIVQLSEEKDTDLNIYRIQKAFYLEQCILETLRIFPPIPMLLRKVTKSFQLSDSFTVPNDSNVVIPVTIVHRNPSIYPNPLQWNPDNFTPDKVKSRHKYSFLAFSGGARDCIGSKYAIIAVKVMLIKILKNYRVDTDYGMDDMRLGLDITLRCASGYKIKMYSRRKSDH